LVGGDPRAGGGVGPREREREAVVVAARQVSRRDLGPGVERRRVVKAAGPLSFLCERFGGELGRHVVIEGREVSCSVLMGAPCSAWPLVIHHWPPVSPGAGIIAFTRTRSSVSMREQTTG